MDSIGWESWRIPGMLRIRHRGGCPSVIRHMPHDGSVHKNEIIQFIQVSTWRNYWISDSDGKGPRRTDGWTDGWMDGWISPSVSRFHQDGGRKDNNLNNNNNSSNKLQEQEEENGLQRRQMSLQFQLSSLPSLPPPPPPTCLLQPGESFERISQESFRIFRNLARIPKNPSESKGVSRESLRIPQNPKKLQKRR